MTDTSRESFLENVRKATRVTVKPHTRRTESVEGEPGRIADCADLSETFANRASATGMSVHRVADLNQAAERLGEIVKDAGVDSVTVPAEGIVTRLPLETSLPDGVSLLTWDASAESGERKRVAFEMQCGVTGVDYAICETGSLVQFSSSDCPRSLSLLGSVHIAVVETSQIIPDLYDLTGRVHEQFPDGPPANITLITGPSKTADIELNLVIGVHGPATVHVILVGS
jgi:L-lactate dehydrogenase complex protein LldG